MDFSDSRRAFLRAVLTTTGGLAVGFGPVAALVAEPKEKTSAKLNAFVELHPSGEITIIAPNPELGQGVHTSLPMLVAEELEADWQRVRVTHPPADERYGPMSVGGSDSIVDYWGDLRRAGAAAREMLLAAAAELLATDKSRCRAEKGVVTHLDSGRSLTYAELLAEAAGQSVPQDPPLKNPRDFSIIGRSTPNVHIKDMVSGKAGYGLDVRLPGMLYAVIARPPTKGGTLRSFDARAALATPGVHKVLELDPLLIRNQAYAEVTGSVAVVAENTWAAIRGREALEVTWRDGPFANEDSAALAERGRARARDSGAFLIRDDSPSADRAPVPARTVELEYELPAIAQAPMEPMNFTVDVREDRCLAIGPTQRPPYLQALLAIWLELPRDLVEVQTTLVGGGFGRRLAVDYGIEAAMISRAVSAPIQVVWTREDDMQHGFYRTPNFHRLAIGLDASGRPAQWRHHIVTEPIAGHKAEAPGIYEVQGAADLPHDVGPVRIEYTPLATGIRPGSWRSVAHSFNTFVINSVLDELAALAERDPYELQQELLRSADREITLALPGRRGRVSCEVSRLKRVLEICARESGWRRPLPENWGRGIAACFFKATYAAHVAHVSIDARKRIRVEQITAVLDCGTIVNPDGVRAQVEGAIMDGIATVFGLEITLREGRVEQNNFDRYRWATIGETPEIDIYIVPNDGPPSGAGEPPYPSVAPAITNAIFDAAGVRVRKLPISRTLT